MAVDEFGSAQAYSSRLSDTQEFTDNSSVLMRQFLSLLGLDVDRDGNLIRRTLNIKSESGKTVQYQTKPLISYEGAIRLIDSCLAPFLSNLGGFTSLKDSDVRRITRSFADDIAIWLYTHREEYDIDERNIDLIINMMSDQVFLQLNRSREGDSNLMSQVMGNTQKQIVQQYRDQNPDEQNAPAQPKRSLWNLGGLMGGR